MARKWTKWCMCSKLTTQFWPKQGLIHRWRFGLCRYWFKCPLINASGSRMFTVCSLHGLNFMVNNCARLLQHVNDPNLDNMLSPVLGPQGTPTTLSVWKTCALNALKWKFLRLAWRKFVLTTMEGTSVRIEYRACVTTLCLSCRLNIARSGFLKTLWQGPVPWPLGLATQ